MSSNSESFTVDVVGENTEQPWKGLFKTKLRLSHRDYLRQDEIRRGLLGEKPENASPRAANTADLFSFISVHLLEAPQWWTMNQDGLALEDDNVIGEVYSRIVEKKAEAAKKAKEKAEADLKELSKPAVK